jgi:hypothetical protein
MRAIYQSLVALFLVFAITSCEKDESDGDVLSKTPPAFPTVQNFDFNNDQTPDFKTHYSMWTWDGLNVSGDLVMGELIPLEQNMILLKQNASYLFLQYNDTVRMDAKEPYIWKSANGGLVTISTTPGYCWQKNWKACSDKRQNDYYMGVKVKSGGVNLIGWIKLQVDTVSGAVYIKDKLFTDKNIVVVGK